MVTYLNITVHLGLLRSLSDIGIQDQFVACWLYVSLTFSFTYKAKQSINFSTEI